MTIQVQSIPLEKAVQSNFVPVTHIRSHPKTHLVCGVSDLIIGACESRGMLVWGPGNLQDFLMGRELQAIAELIQLSIEESI